jgi:hypothetical protein
MNLTVSDYFKLKRHWDKLCDLIPDLKKLGISDIFRFKKEVSKVKPGYKTTEFWMSIGTTIAGILVILGWITPEMQQQLPEIIGKASGGIIALVSLISYIWSRTSVKNSETKKAVNPTEAPLVERGDIVK